MGFMLLYSCGTIPDKVAVVEPCTVVETSEGAKIDCPDGSHIVIKNGIDGKSIKGDKGNSVVGPKGPDGQNAYQIVFKTIPSITCVNGGSTILMATDINMNQLLDPDDTNQISYDVCNGAQGSQGIQGPAGQNCSFNTNTITCGNTSYTLPTPSDGHSVVFSIVSANLNVCPAGGNIIMLANDINDNNQLDTNDSNIQSVTTCNGVNGTDGQDAPVPSNLGLVSLINPCGDAPGIFDEVLIRLSDGNILASFSDNANGQNTRFSLLTPGSFSTTDGSGCRFSVDNNLTITDQNGSKWYK